MSDERTTCHTLYRFFDASGSLLYVGRTINPGRRWREHEKTKPWFADVASLTREVFPTAAEVDAAERLAIANEQPLHNVALNGRAKRPKPALKVKQSEWLSDDLFVARLLSLHADEPSIEAAPICEDPNVESYCECFLCHRERVAYLEAIEADYGDDPTMLGRCKQMWSEYVAAVLPIGMWQDALFDLRLFRPLELAIFSKLEAAPAFAEVVEGVVRIECPFCDDYHNHFLTSGAAITDLLAACSREARYAPVFDDTEFLARWSDWIEAEARAWRAAA